jgi:undecaprenyl-diphosphatase
MRSSKPNWKRLNSTPSALERLLGLDARLSRQLYLPPESSWRSQAKLVAHLGDGPLVFGGLGLVYSLGWLGNKPQFCQAVLQIALIVLTVMGVVTLVKFGVRRQRPRPPGEFVTFQYDAYSFPSGHAARLTALATSVMFFDPLLGLVFGALALSVAAARILVGVHYLGDIVIGLGLGLLIAWEGVTLFSFLLL